MRIGGYTLDDKGYGVQVTEVEAGWSFFLQGEDAEQFHEQWEGYQEQRDNNFRRFLSDYEYNGLFQ
jgi:hypothetical protein|tara:strand:+ start:432 stop:629 length:198 start_codon:yes stop_codon:yes gene_type:complete